MRLLTAIFAFAMCPAAAFGRGFVPLEIHTANGHVTYHILHHAIPSNDLADALETRSFHQKDYPILIYPDTHTSWNSVFETVATIKLLGYTQIMLFAQKGDHPMENQLGFFALDAEHITVEEKFFKRPDK